MWRVPDPITTLYESMKKTFRPISQHLCPFLEKTVNAPVDMTKKFPHVSKVTAVDRINKILVLGSEPSLPDMLFYGCGILPRSMRIEFISSLPHAILVQRVLVVSCGFVRFRDGLGFRLHG